MPRQENAVLLLSKAGGVVFFLLVHHFWQERQSHQAPKEVHWKDLLPTKFGPACSGSAVERLAACTVDHGQILAALQHGRAGGDDPHFRLLVRRYLQLPPAWELIPSLLHPSQPWTRAYCRSIDADDVKLFVNTLAAYDYRVLRRYSPLARVVGWLEEFIRRLRVSRDQEVELLREALAAGDAPERLRGAGPLDQLFCYLHAKVLRHVLAGACGEAAAPQFAKVNAIGRTALHVAAEYGDSHAADALVTALPEAARGRYIATADLYGYTAGDYARLGGYEQTAAALQVLGAHTAPSESEAPGAPVSLFPAAAEDFPTCAAAAASGANVTCELGGWGPPDAGLATDAPWRPVAGEAPCLADVVTSSQFDSKAGEQAFVRHYFAPRRPLLIRGGALMGPDVARHYTRRGLLTAAGGRAVEAYKLPYANVFRGDSPRVSSLRDYVAFLGERVETDVKNASGALEYLFLNVAKDDAHFGFAQFPPTLVEKKLPEIISRQFYLGGALMGAPMHYHNHAFNALAFGRKLWFLRPPANQEWSNEPMYDYLARGGGKGALRCLQEAGDLLFVPADWSHGAICLGDCIGSAFEFNRYDASYT